MNKDISILVADDIAVNRLLLKKILILEGFCVLEAANGLQCLEAIESNKVDIALLDVMMPEMDGFEVCRLIRETFSSSELPVLFTTAKTEDCDISEGFSAGGNDYITKPISKVVLIARLMSQVRMLRASRALTHSYEQISRKRRIETVGVFAAGVAHNFNNILGTVLGSSELIEICTEDADIKSSAIRIATAAKRGAALVDSLLTFARPSGLDCCENPEEILRSATALLPSILDKEIEVVIEVKNNLPALAIETDALAQIFIELLKNATEALDSKGQIRIRADTLDDTDSISETVRFVFSDTGRGIPAHIQDHIFEPFFSTRNLDKRMGIALDGSGLGLTTVYNIVTSASGKISLLETSDRGTSLEVILPVYQA